MMSAPLLEHLFELLLLGIIQHSLDLGFAVLHDLMSLGTPIRGASELSERKLCICCWRASRMGLICAT